MLKKSAFHWKKTASTDFRTKIFKGVCCLAGIPKTVYFWPLQQLVFQPQSEPIFLKKISCFYHFFVSRAVSRQLNFGITLFCSIWVLKKMRQVSVFSASIMHEKVKDDFHWWCVWKTQLCSSREASRRSKRSFSSRLVARRVAVTPHLLCNSPFLPNSKTWIFTRNSAVIALHSTFQ